MENKLKSTNNLFADFTKSGAFISDCEKFRYQLWRRWDAEKPMILFIMLNPSTANAYNDDPTIKRCIGFAKSWGYGGFYVANLFAFRATKPKDLLKADNPFGDANIWNIRQLVDKVDKVVCAWGNKPTLKKILKRTSPFELIDFINDKLYYIELSKDGTPKHPLFLKGDLQLQKLVL